MIYYRLYHSINENEIGKFTQVDDAVVPTSVNDINYISRLLFEKANEKTLLPKGILASKAKKTDLISSGFMGFNSRLFVSSKLNNLLSGSNSKGVQSLKTSLIVKKKKEEEYWLINPYLSDLDFIDFNVSSFGFTDAMGNTILEEIKFKSSSDFIRAYNDNKISAIKNPYPNHRPLLITNVVFREDSKLNFFSLASVLYGGIGFYVSEKLKNEIEEAGCTGIVFTEPNERYP